MISDQHHHLQRIMLLCLIIIIILTLPFLDERHQTLFSQDSSLNPLDRPAFSAFADEGGLLTPSLHSRNMRQTTNPSAGGCRLRIPRERWMEGTKS